MTSNPAKILKINKGNLAIGSNADFCIVDINKPWILKKRKLTFLNSKIHLFDKKMQGKVLSTFVKLEELY